MLAPAPPLINERRQCSWSRYLTCGCHHQPASESPSISLPAMETIPPEIWTEIFSFACTDDGSTGRALSTVSRAVHIICKPLKYQSICVLRPDQLLKLLGVLFALAPETRKVRYLFVASLDECERGDHSAESGREFHVDSKMDVIEHALFEILHLISHSLEALHIHRTRIYRPSVLLDMELPVLSDLTLHGPFKSTNLPSAVLFPSLRRIHIHHFVHHPTRFLEQIIHAAPLMTHLHVPQRSFSTYDVQVALGFSQPIVSLSESPQLPKSLQKLVIEFDPASSSPASWATCIREEQRLRRFRKLSQRDARIRLVKGRDDWVPVDEAKEKWLEGDSVQIER
ncbi:hypothetical protein B0H19DRAFT_1095356, partial [Mycena capillaripes]